MIDNSASPKSRQTSQHRLPTAMRLQGGGAKMPPLHEVAKRCG